MKSRIPVIAEILAPVLLVLLGQLHGRLLLMDDPGRTVDPLNANGVRCLLLCRAPSTAGVEFRGV